jgi:hypothetical protein
VLPSLHGVPRVGSPVSSVLWSTPTSCHPSRTASFPSLRGTAAAPWASLLRALGAASVGRGFSTGVPRTGFRNGGDRTSQVPGEPTMNVPCSPTPARPPHSAAAVLRHRLLPKGGHRLSRQILISRLNHAARSLAVYASQDGLLRRHARLASGWLASLSGRVWSPAGSHERFQIISSSSPRLRLAHPILSIESVRSQTVLERTEPGGS